MLSGLEGGNGPHSETARVEAEKILANPDAKWEERMWAENQLDRSIPLEETQGQAR